MPVRMIVAGLSAVLLATMANAALARAEDSAPPPPPPPPPATVAAEDPPPPPPAGRLDGGIGVIGITPGPSEVTIIGTVPGDGHAPPPGAWSAPGASQSDDRVDLCSATSSDGYYVPTYGIQTITACVHPLIPGVDQPLPEVPSPAEAAASAVARLGVPAPNIVISPQPSDNKWNVLAVGLPLWVWASDQAPVTTSVSEQGIDISMTATRGTVRFDWGDGTSSTCELMRPRPRDMDPLTPSPDCGHTYLKKGDYVVTATAAWAVNWQALGQSGTLPLTSTNTMSIPIREFSSVVVG